jgi:hypothetical protein
MAAGIFFSSCTLKSRPAVIDPLQWVIIDSPEKQKALLEKLDAVNRGLTQFKGKGKLRVYEKGKLNFAERLFWICAEPDQMRLALINTSGVSLASFASDGDWFYIRSHTDDYYSKKPLVSADLDAIISIPVSAADILFILSGRSAASQHVASAYYQNMVEPGYMVVFKNSRKKTIARVYLDQQASRLKKIEWFGASGAVQYEIGYRNYQTIEGYQIPHDILVQNGEQYRAHLQVIRFWPHPAIDPSVFRLHNTANQGE